MLSECGRFGPRRVTLASLLGFCLAASCGGGEAGDDESVAGNSGSVNVAGASAASGTSGAGPSASGTSGAGPSTSGATGAGTAARGGTTGGTANARAGTSGDGAGGSTSGNAGSLGEAPGPTDAGLSVYSMECRGETVSCESAAVHCLGIFLNEGGVGYTCSNLCRTVDDCSDAPSGAEARAGCVAFTNASRCVLVCYDDGEEHSCPSGMGCYRYPNVPVGYCLWL